MLKVHIYITYLVYSGAPNLLSK